MVLVMFDGKSWTSERKRDSKIELWTLSEWFDN